MGKFCYEIIQISRWENKVQPLYALAQINENTSWIDFININTVFALNEFKSPGQQSVMYTIYVVSLRYSSKAIRLDGVR